MRKTPVNLQVEIIQSKLILFLNLSFGLSQVTCNPVGGGIALHKMCMTFDDFCLVTLLSISKYLKWLMKWKHNFSNKFL